MRVDQLGSSLELPPAADALAELKALKVSQRHPGRLVLVRVDDEERLILLGEGRELIEPRQVSK